MRKSFLSKIAMITLFIAVAASGVAAQAGSRVVVNIPFDFVVGEKTLSAGEYTIKTISRNSSQALLVQSADGSESVLTITNRVEARASQANSKVLFRQYGDKYFLSQVWTRGSTAGRELPRSKAERDHLAKVSARTVGIDAR